MATEEAVDALKLYWDHFFKAETGTYEKSTWLDLFLAEFLIRINDGANPKDLINFCPVSGVVTLVGCELLCGIHRVTSSINTLHPAPLATLDPPSAAGAGGSDGTTVETLDVEAKPVPHTASLFARANAQSSEEILKKYLLGGVAWRCLLLLRALGVEGLSCCRQLSSVLIWLFGELGFATATAPPPVDPAALATAPTHRTPIHQLFSHRIWAKQKPPGSKLNSVTSSVKSSATARSRHTGHLESPDTRGRRRLASRSAPPSSESADSTDDLQLLNRSLAIVKVASNDDFQYYNSSLRSSNDYPDSFNGSYSSPRKSRPKADDYLTEKHKQIINSEIGAFEFTLIITDLLRELCKAESSLSGSEGSQISMQCINFSLRNLCSLQFGSSPTQGYAQHVSRIKVALTELLIVSLDKVLVHSDLCAKLINNGILPMLLRILEDIITKNNKVDSNRAKETDKTECENSLQFVFGVAYSITAFFHCLLMQCRSVDKLREFTDQFKLYGECLKGGLLKDCVHLMARIPNLNEDYVVILIKKLIESIGKLINGMKRVRSEVIHSAACPRVRHKACRARVAAGMHHHHDILGEAGAGLPLPAACCISVLYGTLASLLTDDEVSAKSVLRNKILRVMLNCGVCCCFAPGVLMESIVRLMLTHNTTASLCLQVLEHAVYGELGASILVANVTDRLPCSVCEPCDEKKDITGKLCQHPAGPVERKSVWSFLIHYNSLLQLDNHTDVLHATVAHLLRVTPRCRQDMKYELLFSVIYPTFIVAKHRYIIRLEESAYFLTVSCLNIFASLLNTVPFAEQFIQKGGLSYVLELVSLPEFSNQCCSILEIAIVVEIFKLMKENSEMAYYREMSSLSSVQMLFKSLAEVTQRCYKIYELKLPSDKYEELIDVSEEREALGFDLVPPPVERQASMPIAIKTNFVHSENTVEYTMENHIETLKSVWTFWKTCAGLCLYSPVFRAHVAGARALLDSYALLRLALHTLCDPHAPPAPHARLLIKIMEALLTVQLAVADVTGGRSKDRSCALVRNALVAPPAAVLEGGGLRALCEALVRVATAEPSRRHAMPAPALPKVPPLLCPSGSSAECSSSEESAAAVYASEHSDAPASRPDEGYEADVDIGKFDLLPSFKNRKACSAITSITANISSPQLGSLEGMTEWAEYNRRGELTHPELCIIVVDILTHLVDKLLKSKRGNSEGNNMSRVGASLARACMARLAGALAGGRPPPRLLHRLLASNNHDTPAARLLGYKDDQLEDLQRSILELIHVLASQSIEPSELAALLRLFTAESPPLGMLLSALQRLAHTAQHHTPDCILTFPVELDQSESVQPMSEEFVHLTLNGVSSQSHVAENSALKLHQAHLRAGISSVWSLGAARCGVEGVGWAPWLAGFSLVLWLHSPPHSQDTSEPPNSDLSEPESENKSQSKSASKSPNREPRVDLSHVISLGHDSLMFEMWLDTATGDFTFRLTRPEIGCNRVLSSARSSRGIASRRWACVALNVRERVYKRHMYIQVTMMIDGYECETISLPVQGILVRKVTPTHLVLGHARAPGSAPVGVYHLACVSVYRAPLITPYYAMHVAAHGPDSSCMVRCEAPNYPSLLTPDILDLNIDWDQVYEMSSSSLRELHESLLLTYSASAPSLVNLYHHTVPFPPAFTSRVPSSGIMTGSSTQGGGGAPIPETLFARWAGAPLPSRHRGFTPALYMLQGVEVLLYLYARVVELDGTAVEQAMALGILLRVCRVDNRLYTSFHTEEVPDMLLTVFSAPRCQLTPHLLKVILDEACSVPILRCSGGGVQVVGRSDAVLLEPALLVLLARAAARLDTTKEFTWEVEGSTNCRVAQRGSLWALALCCMRVLLRPSHPRRAFNHYQLSRRDLLHHLLLACKERFLNSESGPMEPCASESLVELVRGLTGSPPAPHRLALLCDFLLLMHQASDTFVTHSRANFYFLLTSETQEMSEYSTTTKRNSSKRIKRRSQNRPERSSASTEDATTDNSLYLPREMFQSRESSDKMESSIESTKQLKGIINMQLKEGRKHTVSSTSENSDTTADPEPAEGSEGSERLAEGGTEADGGTGNTEGKAGGVVATEGAGDLQEYIVVDEDEVNHTTVEMYSSGIYHQGRVRAGASPDWAACEGLLLLLRDTIAVLPDHTLHQVVGGAVQAESVIVLANHRSAGVRAAVVRVLCALQRRAPPELAKKLHQAHYYTHLANQISLYEGSWELATACAALITKCDVPLEDQLDDDIWVDVWEESLQRCPPLLALLPCCLYDIPLAHNITRIMERIIDKAPLKLITDVSLVETVVRAIRAIGLRDGEFEGRELLLLDLQSLLTRLAVKALKIQHTMQTIVEMHHMLAYVEQSANQDESAVVVVARGAQAQLYSAQIDYLEERLHASYTEQTKHGNYFTNVLTSAVSLGGGGGVAGWSRGELGARLASTVSRAVSYILTQHPRAPLGSDDGALLERLLHMLPTAVSGSQQRPKWWVGSAEWMAPLQELAGWALAGGGTAAGVAAIRALYRAPEPALQLLAPDPQHMRKLAVYLLMILKSIHAAGEEGPPPVEYAITDWARDWALALQEGLPERLDNGALPLEASACLRRDEERWNRAAARPHIHVGKVVFAKETLAARVAESAMAVTRVAVEAQNAERKRFMEHLRGAQARCAAATLAWDRLVDTHTHKQGVWHDPRSYPASWTLDPTEGPGRVRVRLRRAHLNIHPKFLKPQYRYKAETLTRGGPLRSVLGGAGGARGGLVARLQLNETVAYMARTVCVTVAAETQGELLLSDRCVHFVPDDVEEEKKTTNSRRRDKQYNPEVRAPAQSWPLESVVQVVTRRWCLREVAVELFLSTGHAHLLAFAGPSERAAFLKALQAMHLPAKIEPDTLSEAMSQWRSGAITNWEYLMRLNGLAGRSYNDLMQYPVLPFVIADYSSRILDLMKPEVFRDLSRPMAVQNKNREQHYIKIYNDLKAAHREGSSPLIARAPHHYASLYSNSGGVLHYLVRLPPFTELFLNYQDNNFDMPDRTFHSLVTTWRLITNDSPTDVKELIPELFYLPEMFHNNEGLNLGVRQCGAAIDNVELPAWAADARLFTLAHRQALEARHITEMLPAWLDLVFGYKQTGQAALDAINVFPACTYYGFDPESLEDENDRTAAADMVRLYGQAPRQLLRTPHPSVQPAINTQAQLENGVFAGVSGVRWGRYCGSPALPPAVVTTRRACAGASALHAMPHARTVAAVTHATALQALPGDSGASQNGGGQTLGLVSWGHSDNIVRLKRRRDAPPDLLLHTPALDQITKVSSSSVTASCPLFLGHVSGRVLAVRVRNTGPGLAVRVRTRVLVAHTAAITAVYASVRAALLLTASGDGTIILWDLNKLSYIRTLPNRDSAPVTHGTISDTLCDVATVHTPLPATHAPRTPPSIDDTTPRPASQNGDADADAADEYEKDAAYKYKSLIRVHTCNAMFVGSVKVVEEVSCVVYSSVPEGVSVNCVGAGLRSGGVRLYSSWDLRPTVYIPPAANAPLTCLTFSSDCMILFGCYEGGSVVAWEATGSTRPAPVRIHPAHALL